MASAAPETPFPPPESDAGRLLAHLVAREIPGVTIVTTAGALATATGLSPAAARGALKRLADAGIVAVDARAPVARTAPAGSARLAGATPAVQAPAAGRLDVTVLMAPALDELGIEASWGEPIPAATERNAALSNPSAMLDASEAAAGHPVAEPPARRLRGRRAGTDGARAAAQALPVPEPEAGAARATGAAPAEQTPLSTGRGGRRPGGTAAGTVRTAESGASVDETALARGFVERFERLLADLEEWRKRCQQAEERAAAAEKQARAAEKRAESAEAKLAAANERLRAWSELTRRMQQLSRQADSRAGRARVTPDTT